MGAWRGVRGVAAQNSAWWEMHCLDSGLLGCGLGGIHPWVGFPGMAFGLGCGIVCASPTSYLCPSCLKTWCFISSGVGLTPCWVLHTVIEGGGTQKERALGEMGRRISILVLAFWPCPGDHCLATPAIRQRIFLRLLEGGQSHQLL